MKAIVERPPVYLIEMSTITSEIVSLMISTSARSTSISCVIGKSPEFSSH